MKKIIVVSWLLLVLTGIAAIFWHQEWKYNLPTPVPDNYINAATGKRIYLPVGVGDQDSKPVFLHFFNPACPCSRFNMKHFKSLVKEYTGSASFVIVVISNKTYTEKEIQQKFDIDLPVLFDTSIARSCGVYSTPQAVILDTEHRLFYKGNYNRTRYCADKKTEYARIALQAMLSRKTVVFDQLALTAYGCQLPTCTN